MRSIVALALALAGAHAFPNMKVKEADLKDSVPEFAETAFPEGILGKWMPSGAPQSILGPLAYEFLAAGVGAFSAQRDPATGDVWFTILDGQVRTRVIRASARGSQQPSHSNSADAGVPRAGDADAVLLWVYARRDDAA